ncbi:MAG: hypothetical protein COA85_12540 [Robiginitomaculum sp.]|nr:MAG: hypothetical protein COA85_12540 [Robiginitomaculum sp.]
MANAMENANTALTARVEIEVLAPFEGVGELVKIISGYPIKVGGEKQCNFPFDHLRFLMGIRAKYPFPSNGFKEITAHCRSNVIFLRDCLRAYV